MYGKRFRNGLYMETYFENSFPPSNHNYCSSVTQLIKQDFTCAYLKSRICLFGMLVGVVFVLITCCYNNNLNYRPLTK